jgi:hypothetical protein
MNAILKKNRRLSGLGLLDNFGVVTIPANPDHFILNDHFKENVSDEALVKISRLGSSLKEWFSGVVEDPSDAMILRKGNLRKSSLDNQIIAESGGNDKVAASWFAIWHLAVSGQLDKRRWNVIYVEDEVRFPEDKTISFINAKNQKRVLRSVFFEYNYTGDSWFVGAYSVRSTDEWIVGSLVFSRVPVAP